MTLVSMEVIVNYSVITNVSYRVSPLNTYRSDQTICVDSSFQIQLFCLSLIKMMDGHNKEKRTQFSPMYSLSFLSIRADRGKNSSDHHYVNVPKMEGGT